MKFKELMTDLNEAAINKTVLKFVTGDDLGLTKKQVVVKGANLLIYTSFNTGGEKRLKSWIADWSSDGTYGMFIEEELGVKIKVVKSGLNDHSKIFSGPDGGDVWVELSFS
jgi:hypothetical protein